MKLSMANGGLFLGAVLLAGCGGGGGGSSSDSGSGTALQSISPDNALAVTQGATRAVSESKSGGDELDAALTSLSDEQSSGTSAGATMTALSDTTVQCTGGGTLGYSFDNPTIHYVATDCVDAGGSTHDGKMSLTAGTWPEYPDGGSQAVIEIGGNGFTRDDCRFHGGLVVRSYVDMPQSPPDGDYHVIVEFGTLDSGFSQSACSLGEGFSLRPNTSTRSELRYTLSNSGSVVSNVSHTVRTGGALDVEGGRVEFSATDLAWATNEEDADTESLWGDPAHVCPTSGSITVTGANNTEVTAYFGDDAPAGQAVQIIGPDGYTREYATCDDFLNAEPPQSAPQWSGLSGAAGEWAFYEFEVEPGHQSVHVVSEGDTGFTLYLYEGSTPADPETGHACSTYVNDWSKECESLSPNAGTWTVGLYAGNTFETPVTQAAYSDVALRVEFDR